MPGLARSNARSREIRSLWLVLGPYGSASSFARSTAACALLSGR